MPPQWPTWAYRALRQNSDANQGFPRYAEELELSRVTCAMARKLIARGTPLWHGPWLGRNRCRQTNQTNVRIPRALVQPSPENTVVPSAKRWRKRRILTAGAAILDAKAKRIKGCISFS
jgi:hypothetical protein